MLKRSTLALSLVIIIAMAFGISAQEKKGMDQKVIVNFSAVSPQAEEGKISGEKGFTIDIVLDLEGYKNLTGGTFGVGFYSPDKSLKNITHVPVDTSAEKFQSIEFLNGWKESYNALNLINLHKQFGFDGNLPDSTYFIFAGIEGFPNDKEPLPVIRYNLMAEGSGKLCIDSVGKATPDLDWLFPANYEVSFNGPYCWEIK